METVEDGKPKAKMQRGRVDGNVVTITRPKRFYEDMSYSELLAERRFFFVEKKRIKTARYWSWRVDPRCMWAGPLEIDKLYSVMLAECDQMIVILNKEMAKRFKNGE